jgi:hypothetical protein
MLVPGSRFPNCFGAEPFPCFLLRSPGSVRVGYGRGVLWLPSAQPAQGRRLYGRHRLLGAGGRPGGNGDCGRHVPAAVAHIGGFCGRDAQRYSAGMVLPWLLLLVLLDNRGFSQMVIQVLWETMMDSRTSQAVIALPE